MNENDEPDQGPDERDADLGWGGPELPLEPAFRRRVGQGLIIAIALLLLAIIALPLVLIALR